MYPPPSVLDSFSRRFRAIELSLRHDHLLVGGVDLFSVVGHDCETIEIIFLTPFVVRRVPHVCIPIQLHDVFRAPIRVLGTLLSAFGTHLGDSRAERAVA